MAIGLRYWNEAALAGRQAQFQPYSCARGRRAAAADAEEEAATPAHASRCMACSQGASGFISAGLYGRRAAPQQNKLWQSPQQQQQLHAGGAHQGLCAAAYKYLLSASEQQRQQRSCAVPFHSAAGLGHRKRQRDQQAAAAEQQEPPGRRTFQVAAQKLAAAASARRSNPLSSGRSNKDDVLTPVLEAQEQVKLSSSPGKATHRGRITAAASIAADAPTPELTTVATARNRPPVSALAAARAGASTVDGLALRKRATARGWELAARERMRVAIEETGGYTQRPSTCARVQHAVSRNSAAGSLAVRELSKLLQKGSRRATVDSPRVLGQYVVCQQEPRQRRPSQAHEYRFQQYHGRQQQALLQQQHWPQLQEGVQGNRGGKGRTRRVEQLLQALIQNQTLPLVENHRDVLPFTGGTSEVKLKAKSILGGLRGRAGRRMPRGPLQPRTLQASPDSGSVWFCPPPFGCTALQSSFAPSYHLSRHRQEVHQLQNQQQLQSQQHQQQQQLQHQTHTAEDNEGQHQQRHRSHAECDSKNFSARLSIGREMPDVRHGTAVPVSSAQPSSACARTAAVAVASSAAVASQSVPSAVSNYSSSVHALFCPFHIHCPYSYNRATPCSAAPTTRNAGTRTPTVDAATNGVADEVTAAAFDDSETRTSSLNAIAATGVVPASRRGVAGSAAGPAAVSLSSGRQAVLRGGNTTAYSLGPLWQRVPISYIRRSSASRGAVVSFSDSEGEKQKHQRQNRRVHLLQRENVDKLQQQSQQHRQEENTLEEKGQQQDQQDLRLKDVNKPSAGSITDGPRASHFSLDEQSSAASLDCIPVRGQGCVRSYILPQPIHFLRSPSIATAAKNALPAAGVAAAPPPAGLSRHPRPLWGAGPLQNGGAFAEEMIAETSSAAAAFSTWSVWQGSDAVIAEERERCDRFRELRQQQGRVQERIATQLWRTEKTALLQLQLRVRSYKAGQEEMRAILQGTAARIRQAEEEQQQERHQWAVLMCRRDSEVHILRREKDALQQELRAQAESSRAEVDSLTEQLNYQQQQLMELQQLLLQHRHDFPAALDPQQLSQMHEQQRAAIEQQLRQELQKQLRAELEDEVRQEAERQLTQRSAGQQLRSNQEQKLREEAHTLQASLRGVQAKEQQLQEELRLLEKRLMTKLEESEKYRQQAERARQEAQQECAEHRKLIELLRQGQQQAATQEELLEKLHTTEEQLHQVSRQLSGEKLQRQQVNEELQELQRQLSGERKQRRQLESELQALLETPYNASKEAGNAISAEEREKRWQSLRRRHQMLRYQRHAQDAALFKATLEAHRADIAPHVLQYDQAVLNELDKHAERGEATVFRPGRRVRPAGEMLQPERAEQEDGKLRQTAAGAEEARRRATVQGGQARVLPAKPQQKSSPCLAGSHTCLPCRLLFSRWWG